MTAVVFAGPSLGREAPPPDIVLLPPAAQGDVYRAIRDGARLIGLIDGLFEGVPAVWHKEILWALAEGVPVLGAASMGALRAAELAPFGMQGIGAIYQAFAEGRLEDDDEVALLHGPAETGWLPLTEAMVDVRATLEAAVSAGVLTAAEAAELARIAKAIFYKRRTWAAILASGPEPAQERLLPWLPDGRVDLKRRDARLLLDAISRWQGPVPLPSFRFERTELWEDLVAAADPAPLLGGAAGPSLLDEARLAGIFPELRRRALMRRLASAEAVRSGFEAAPEAVTRAVEDFRRAIGLHDRAALDAWLAERGVDREWLRRHASLSVTEALLLDRLAAALEPDCLDELRAHERYPELAARAAAKAALLDDGQRPAPPALLAWYARRRSGVAPSSAAELATALGFARTDDLYRALRLDRLYWVARESAPGEG